MRTATLTIRRLPVEVKRRLRQRAAEHDRSMEAEAREILREALARASAQGSASLVKGLRRHFADVGYWEFERPPQDPARDPKAFR